MKFISENIIYIIIGLAIGYLYFTIISIKNKLDKIIDLLKILK